MNRNAMTSRLAATSLLVFMLAACGDDSTGPSNGDQGRVSAMIIDDGGAAAPAGGGGSSFQGQMSGSARVEIYSDAEGWVSLGPSSNTSLALQSTDEATVHSQVSVPASSYTRVRLVLEGCDADVAAGGTLGGITLGASVSITMGGSDGRVEIEKQVSTFNVTADGHLTVVFDLNSEAWIDQESAESETATDAEIQSATEAEVVQQ